MKKTLTQFLSEASAASAQALKLNLKSDGKILASGDPTIHKKLLKVIQKVK